MLYLANAPPVATRKLFHEQPFLREASARVVFVHKNLVVLDQTIFYAESGGQVADTGTIAGVPVLDVQKQGGRPVKVERDGMEPIYVNTDTLVVHQVDDTEAIEPGQEVKLVLDWDRRLQVMKYHSAAHFLFHAIDMVLFRRKGEHISTKGCFIKHDGCRFDIDNDLDPSLISEVEDLANSEIALGHPITMHPDPACDDVFYWECGNIVIPCGGTHVASAADLRPMRVTRRSKGRASLRISGTFRD